MGRSRGEHAVRATWIGTLTLAALCVLLAGLAGPTPAVAGDAPRVRLLAGPRFNVWVPAGRIREPAPVVVALHGVSGDGQTIAHGLVEECSRQGWLLVAPTMKYGDWRNPNQVVADDVHFTNLLNEILDALPGQTGIETRPRVMLFGFSRGFQLAHRYAFFYPERVRGVAGYAAGTYTLPYTRAADNRTPLNLPYGLANAPAWLGRPLDWAGMRRVRFLVGVGAKDNRDSDVPRSWDPLIGRNRVERARNFHQMLLASGIKSQLVIYPNTDHSLTQPMRADALAFFRTLVREEDVSAQAVR